RTGAERQGWSAKLLLFEIGGNKTLIKKAERLFSLGPNERPAWPSGTPGKTRPAASNAGTSFSRFVAPRILPASGTPLWASSLPQKTEPFSRAPYVFVEGAQ